MARKKKKPVSPQQGTFFCVEYGRAKRGMATKTKIKKSKLREYCKRAWATGMITLPRKRR